MVAVLIDRAGATMVSFGSGAHLSPTVAAVRAITEAAQARLTLLHGSREELNERAYRVAHDALFAHVRTLTRATSWLELDEHATEDLDRDLALALSDVRELGYDHVYAADLSQGLAGISAVKVLVPGARQPSWI
jgi:ribosomal protein S12 methylthiotransferase accessory factor